MTWQRVLRTVGLADVALLVAGALILGDLEAFALSALMLVTTAWFALRPGRVAALILGIEFANVLAWMVPGMVSNLADHASLGAVLAPMALAATSAVGLGATVVWVTAPGRRNAPSRVAGLTVVLAVAILVGGTALAAANGSAVRQLASGDLAISAKNARFSTSSLSAPAGTVTVDLTNEDLFWHTFTSNDLGVDLQVPVKTQRKATFSARPGVYEYHCAIPGHESIGMKGTLTVR